MATIHIEDNDSRLVDEFFVWVKDLADRAIAERGHFSWALSGGSTPKQLFAKMADAEHSPFPWQATEVFWGDERDVMPTHPDSNFGVADALVLRRLDPRPRAIERWLTEYRPAAALADYRTKLQSIGDAVMPTLDLVLLGLGPEGHTASLFPESPALTSRDWVAHVYVPEHHTWRYTLTLPVINHARTVAFLVTGKAKADIVQTIQATDANPHWPATMVADEGRLHWFLDHGAAGLSES